MPSNPDRRPRRQRPPSSGRPRNARNAKQRSNSAVGSSLRGSSSQSLGSRKRSPTAREAIIIAALAAILILLLVLLINGIRGCVGRRVPGQMKVRCDQKGLCAARQAEHHQGGQDKSFQRHGTCHTLPLCHDPFIWIITRAAGRRQSNAKGEDLPKSPCAAGLFWIQ